MYRVDSNGFMALAVAPRAAEWEHLRPSAWEDSTPTPPACTGSFAPAVEPRPGQGHQHGGALALTRLQQHTSLHGAEQLQQPRRLNESDELQPQWSLDDAEVQNLILGVRAVPSVVSPQQATATATQFHEEKRLLLIQRLCVAVQELANQVEEERARATDVQRACTNALQRHVKQADTDGSWADAKTEFEERERMIQQLSQENARMRCIMLTKRRRHHPNKKDKLVVGTGPFGGPSPKDHQSNLKVDGEENDDAGIVQLTISGLALHSPADHETKVTGTPQSPSTLRGTSLGRRTAPLPHRTAPSIDRSNLDANGALKMEFSQATKTQHSCAIQKQDHLSASQSVKLLPQRGGSLRTAAPTPGVPCTPAPMQPLYSSSSASQALSPARVDSLAPGVKRNASPSQQPTGRASPNWRPVPSTCPAWLGKCKQPLPHTFEQVRGRSTPARSGSVCQLELPDP